MTNLVVPRSGLMLVMMGVDCLWPTICCPAKHTSSPGYLLSRILYQENHIDRSKGHGGLGLTSPSGWQITVTLDTQSLGRCWMRACTSWCCWPWLEASHETSMRMDQNHVLWWHCDDEDASGVSMGSYAFSLVDPVNGVWASLLFHMHE
jgi:hypothetical protein